MQIAEIRTHAALSRPLRRARRNDVRLVRIINGTPGGFWLGIGDDEIPVSGWCELTPAPTRRASAKLPAFVLDLADRVEAAMHGEAVRFDDVPLPPAGAFTAVCWKCCRSIPFGETVSYGELATMMGRAPSAARAVGQAMRRNPQPIITPCHRVLSERGTLHGYGGHAAPGSAGRHIKQTLLNVEAAANCLTR